MPDRRRRIRAPSHSPISEEVEPLDSGDDDRNSENTRTMATALPTGASIEANDEVNVEIERLQSAIEQILSISDSSEAQAVSDRILLE